MKKKRKPGMKKVTLDIFHGHVREPENLIANAQDIGRLCADLLKEVGKTPASPYQQYWYSLQTAKKVLEHAENELFQDLKHLGVVIPETWDFSKIEPKSRLRK
jgi:hypothetical protein